VRRIASFTMAAICSASAFGQALLDCIEPDVLHTLVLQGQGARPPAFAATVPQELSALRMPGAFTWIGSAERASGVLGAAASASQVTAAWRSNLAPDAARDATAGALAASGWEVRPSPFTGVSVFASRVLPASQLACRAGMPVNFTTSAMDGVTYVMATIQRGNNNAICTQAVRPSPIAASGMASHVPRLDLPINPETGMAAQPAGESTSQGTGFLNARSEFDSRESAGNIARHFARQMAEQGWSSDANWSGASTAGSSWSRRPDADSLLHASLSVTSLDGRRVAASMRISKLQ
jgi:hypothetical protein